MGADFLKRKLSAKNNFQKHYFVFQYEYLNILKAKIFSQKKNWAIYYDFMIIIPLGNHLFLLLSEPKTNFLDLKAKTTCQWEMKTSS